MTTELTLATAAQLLAYPHPRLAGEASAAADWLDGRSPEAAAHARRFADALAGMTAGALEEAYTAAFDFATAGTIYAGEHLFGPSQARATFLARLKVMQRDHGVEQSVELPDHVAELLRLAAAMPAGEERDDLLRDAVLPTARSALVPLEEAKHPFAHALAAAIAVTQQLCGATPEQPQRPPALRVVESSEELFCPSPEVTP